MKTIFLMTDIPYVRIVIKSYFKIFIAFSQKNTYIFINIAKKGLDKVENECYNGMPHE